MASPKRKALTLQERVEVIKMNESGKSARAIAEHFKVGKTQIQSTIKRKAEVLSDFEISRTVNTCIIHTCTWVTQREMVIPVMTSDLHLYIATTCP
jgi:IS30 family transposase